MTFGVHASILGLSVLRKKFLVLRSCISWAACAKNKGPGKMHHPECKQGLTRILKTIMVFLKRACDMNIRVSFCK